VSPYATPAAFHAAVEARLRAAARDQNRPINQLRRRFFTQRFLARIYSGPDTGWILLGGTALLARTPTGRHSKDIDFVRSADPVESAGELAALTAAHPLDPYRFTINPAGADGDHARLSVTVALGATTVERFSVDITRRILATMPEAIRAQPVIEIDGIDELPTFLAISLPQQVADKLCAMYELHGPTQQPSSRYRDLVDLMIISRTHSIDAAATAAALADEQHTRSLMVPTKLPAPGPQWARGYPPLARQYLTDDLHALDAAMGALRVFVGPLLTGSSNMKWQPDDRGWS
jgi:Nucleotidyl transferase AbiEii toxin, Type IV TA system